MLRNCSHLLVEVWITLRSCLDIHIPSQSMIKYSVPNTQLEQWRMLVQSLLMTCMSSRRKFPNHNGHQGPTQYCMNCLICGLVTWWQWDGGMICGLMRVLLNSSPIYVRIAYPMMLTIGCNSWNVNNGGTWLMRNLQHIQSIVRFRMFIRLRIYLMESHMPKELHCWNRYTML